LEEEEEEEKKKKNRPINSSCQLTPEPHTNPNSFRHIQTATNTQYFPRSITLWNQLPTTFTMADTVDGFKSMIPVSALIPIFTPYHLW
jgi:hypothetical protein